MNSFINFQSLNITFTNPSEKKCKLSKNNEPEENVTAGLKISNVDAFIFQVY